MSCNLKTAADIKYVLTVLLFAKIAALRRAKELPATTMCDFEFISLLYRKSSLLTMTLLNT